MMMTDTIIEIVVSFVCAFPLAYCTVDLIRFMLYGAE
jgi:hypothetical protein